MKKAPRPTTHLKKFRSVQWFRTLFFIASATVAFWGSASPARAGTYTVKLVLRSINDGWLGRCS